MTGALIAVSTTGSMNGSCHAYQKWTVFMPTGLFHIRETKPCEGEDVASTV